VSFDLAKYLSLFVAEAAEHHLAVDPVAARDLTSHLYAGRSHIWPVSPLAPYVTHHKGKSKQDAARKRAVVTEP